MTAKNAVTKKDFVWFLSFLIGFAFILYKCRYGFSNIDESYYLTIPYRFFQGDSMCLHEWNLGQTSSVLIYPFFWLYMKITGSTEGILLAFRYLYTLLHSLTALFLYLKLRQVNWGAGFASVLYLIFTPFGIMALSYNTMALGLLIITSVLLYTSKTHQLHLYFLAGLSFAGAVLCCPFLVLIYVLYGAACIGVYLHSKPSRQTEGRPVLYAFLAFTAGCAAAAAAFLLYLFRRCTLGQLLQMLPVILDDPDHQTVGFLENGVNLLKVVLASNRIAPAVFLCAAALAGILLIDKRRKDHANLYFCGAGLLTLAYAAVFFFTNPYLNFMMFPLAIWGFFCFLLYPEMLLREMVFLWLPGVLYAFCIHWASNQGFYAISDATCISSLGSIVMMVMFLKKSEQMRRPLWKLLPRSVPVLLAVFVAATAYIRYNSLFWENGGMDNMTYEISVGAQKGILASPEHGHTYEQMYQDTAPVREHASEKVLYLSQNTWLYLDDTKRNASFSAWFLPQDHNVEKLIRYYEYNPDKLPDIVYCEKQHLYAGSPVSRFLEDLNYRVEETEFGCIWKE